jgi:hypothetical protein
MITRTPQLSIKELGLKIRDEALSFMLEVNHRKAGPFAVHTLAVPFASISNLLYVRTIGTLERFGLHPFIVQNEYDYTALFITEKDAKSYDKEKLRELLSRIREKDKT